MIVWAIFIPASALILIIYFDNISRLFGKKRAANKIESSNSLKASPRELKNTIASLLLFAFAGAFVGYSIEQGWGQVYTSHDGSFSSIFYMIASFFLALGIHDIYFYATHRWLHSKFMFKHVHVWHHKSHSSNAWSSFSFHPIEGVIQIGIVPLVLFVLPIHEYVLMGFSLFLTMMSVYGHCGYELRPNKKGVFSAFNTSLHHYQHHKFVRYNFGIYLNYWDKIFNTNHPDYEQTFIKISERIADEKSNSNSPHTSSLDSLP